MRLRYVVLLLAATFVLASAGTAYGGPSLKKIVRDISGLKARTDRLAENDRLLVERIRLVGLKSSIVTADLRASTTPGWYSGQATCPSGSTLTGGGAKFRSVQWSSRTVSSNPDPGGTSWEVSVNAGSETPLTQLPQAYAVCATAN